MNIEHPLFWYFQNVVMPLKWIVILNILQSSKSLKSKTMDNILESLDVEIIFSLTFF